MPKPQQRPTLVGRPSIRRRLAALGLGLGLLPLAMALGVSCGETGDALPPRPGGHSGVSPTGGAGGPCIEGETRPCNVTIGDEGGVLTCLHGVRTCVDGRFGICEGTLTAQPSPTPPGEEVPGELPSGNPAPLSLSDAGPCVNNPCDPDCQGFNEVPDGGVTPPSGVSETYQGGDISSIPGGFFGKGVNEPCASAADCQFDHVCQLPTSGSCTHGKCVEGVTLDTSCDPCVADICAAEPSCCNGPSGTCGHGVCTTGDALTDGCDPCVSEICAADSWCCQNPYYTPGCAHEACAPGAALAKSCDPCVTDICAASPTCCTATFDASCAHSACTLGAALSAACDPCVTGICDQNQGCCGTVSTFNAACTTAPQGHSPCIAGKKLPAACDPCVQAICADPLYASCCTGNGNAWTTACVNAVNAKCAPKSCNTTWTQACANLVATTAECGGQTCTPTWTSTCAEGVTDICGLSCIPGTWDEECVSEVATICGDPCPAWDESCVEKVGSVCGALCEPQGSDHAECEHDPCLRGPPLDADCSACVTQICDIDPYCCTTAWDATCKNRVTSVCGEVCTSGDCVPWEPGQTQPACDGIDLTVGVPCTGNLPICNRGDTIAPAGIAVWIYPGNSSHFPNCAPSANAETDRCTVPEAIEPGKCVNITGANCLGGSLSGNKTVMANPPASAGNAGAVAECSCHNNWSDYHSGSCDSIETSGYAPMVYMQIYTAACASGQSVQWGYFAYETITPGDSSILFEAHTAATAASLGPPLTELATAQLSPDTQSCPMGAGGGCPVDLQAVLGSAAGQQPVLELVVTLEPTSDNQQGPTLTSWEISYSCVDSQ
jgi:hypothetical protein